MADRLSPAQRSAVMRCVRQADTAPEMIVRRVAFGMGYRYRLHVKGLPGSPDLVFPGRRAIIFVHGCFWHRHECKNWRAPTSNTEYWLPKLKRNAERDREVIAELEERGWRVLVIWECETKDREEMKSRLASFLL